VRVRERAIDAFHSVRGDTPERILVSTIPTGGEWTSWRAGAAREVQRLETDYEGAGLPIEPSVKGLARGPVCQLRDPCIYEEDGRLYPVYSVAGESGLAIAAIEEPPGGA
jgi:hypothetical protein